jgi:hypothetical protein
VILAVALTLALQEPQDFRGAADRLAERIQWITSTIRDLREKKRVHAEALAEVEAYLGTVTRTGTDLQAKAKQLEEMQRQLAAKKKEHLALETEYESEQKLYKQQLDRFEASGRDIKQRWDALDAEIKAHNARQNDAQDAEAYRRNAERLNQNQASLKAESDRHENVNRPAVVAAYDKVERMRLNTRAVEGAKVDLDNELRWDSGDFRIAIDSMEGPAEGLHSLLMEATGKRPATNSFRTFASRREAAAQPLAEAFGGGLDLPDHFLSEIYIIRAARDRGTTREYIVERLRLGELIEGIRALVPETSDKSVAADRAFDLPSVASKPSSLVKGAAWKMPPPEPSTLQRQPPPGLRGK